MKIYLHFTGGNAVSFGEVQGVIEEIKEIAITHEKMELRRIRKEVPEIPSPAVTKAIAQLDEPLVQYQAVKVAAAEKGSLGLEIALAAFGYWVLDNTLKETLQDAWKESPMHAKVKGFFLKTRGDKLRAIQKQLNSKVQKLTAADSHKNLDIEVPMFAKLDEKSLELSVRINSGNEFKESDRIPAYDELIARDQRGD